MRHPRATKRNGGRGGEPLTKYKSGVGLVDYGTGAVVAVYAYKKDFLKYEGSPEVTSDVLFVGRSRDLIFTIKY